MRDISTLLFQTHLLSLAGNFFIVSGQVSCSEETERWCEIYPASTTLNISPGDSKVITCTIPSTPGTVNFCNQFGNPVTSLPNVDLYPPMIDDSNSCAQMSYRVNISWTVDKHIREQLKIVQCAASFEGISRPSWTSVVSINFLDSEKELTTAASPLQTTQSTSTIRVTSTTSTVDSGCVCTPAQCADMLPEIDSNNELLSQNQTSQGFKTSCTLYSSLFSAILVIFLCSFVRS